jgi:hypothetical protein
MGLKFCFGLALRWKRYYASKVLTVRNGPFPYGSSRDTIEGGGPVMCLLPREKFQEIIRVHSNSTEKKKGCLNPFWFSSQQQQFILVY